MIISRTADAVYKFSLVGKQDQSLRVLVQSSDRINPDRIIDGFNNILGAVIVSCRTYDSARLVIGEKHRSRCLGHSGFRVMRSCRNAINLDGVRL